MLVTHPLLVDPVTGRRSRQERKTILGCLEQPAFAGWTFGADWERVDGAWTIELQWRGETLATQVFHVSGGRGPLSGKASGEAPRAQTRAPAPAPSVVRQERHDDRERSRVQATSPIPAAAPSPQSAVAEAWFVQVAACLHEDNARKDAATLRAKGYSAGVRAWVDNQGRTWRLVLVGAYATRAQAEAAAAAFKRKERRAALVKSVE